MKQLARYSVPSGVCFDNPLDAAECARRSSMDGYLCEVWDRWDRRTVAGFLNGEPHVPTVTYSRRVNLIEAISVAVICLTIAAFAVALFSGAGQ